MNRIAALLCILALPVLAACDTFDIHQCDQFSALDDQVSCLDTAFFDLSERAAGQMGERERESERDEGDLREMLADCEGLRERFGDDEWLEEYGDDEGLRERLGWCTDLWERLDREDDASRTDQDDDARWDEDERWDEDGDEDLRDLLEACSDLREELRDEEDWDEEEAAAIRERLAFCATLWDRMDGERGVRGLLSQMHCEARGTVERSDDSGERRRTIRDALRRGRDLLRAVRERSRDARDGGERPERDADDPR